MLIKVKVFTLLVIAVISIRTTAQIPLTGVVTVQNSKTKTGKTEYVPRAQVDAPGHSQPQQSDNKGWFTLRIVGLQYGNKVPVVVTLPQATWKDYIVVNAEELQTWKIGYDTVNIYVAKEEDFERIKAEIARINFDNYVSKKQYEQMRQRLQQELAVTKSRSERYKQILDSLTVINDDEDRMQQLVESFAERIARINMDNMSGSDAVTESRRRAYECAMRGEADSVMHYLNDRLELLHKATSEKASAERLADEAQRLAEETRKRQQNAERAHAALIEDVLLMARTSAAQLKHDEARKYYEEALNADTLNFEPFAEYVRYLLFDVNLWNEAKALLDNRLPTLKRLADEYPQQHLTELATTFAILRIYYYKTFFGVDTAHCQTLYNYADTTVALYEKVEQMRGGRTFQIYATALNAKGVAALHLYELTQDGRYLQTAKEAYSASMAKYEKLKSESADLHRDNYLVDKYNYAYFLDETGESSKARDNYLQCVEECEKLLQRKDEGYIIYQVYYTGHIGVGKSYLVDNQHNKAHEYFERGFRILDSLTDVNPRKYWSDHIGLLKQIYIRLTDRDNDEPYALTLLEKMVACREKILSACPEFGDVRLFAYEDEGLHLDLVWRYLQTGKGKEARLAAEKFLQRAPDDTDMKLNYAHALLFEGDYKAAEDIYQSLKPLQSEAHGKPFSALILQDFDDLEKSIPPACKDEVDKIRKMLNIK